MTTIDEQKEEDFYTVGLSYSHCDNDNGSLVVDDEVKFNRLINMMDILQIYSVCEQCTMESEINKVTSKT